MNRSVRTILLPLIFLLAAIAAPLSATTTPVPAGSIRIHYFRPDGNYLGWTVYAFGDTTEPNNYGAGPVALSGQDSFGAYFDVGVTSGATNVGVILHNGNTKDPGINEFANPAVAQEFWQISGAGALVTVQPPTIQQTDPAIPVGSVRIHYFRPDNNYANSSIFTFGATTTPTSGYCGSSEIYVSGYDTFGAYYDVGVNTTSNGTDLGFILHNCALGVKDPGPDQHLNVGTYNQAWIVSGSSTVFTAQPPTEYPTDPAIPAGFARIHYYRPDGNFSAWTVYAFNDTTEDTNNYGGGPVFVTGYDSYGAFYDVSLKPNPQDLGFIVHNIQTGTKDPGPDQHLNVAQYNQAWIISGDANVYTSQPTAAQLLNSVFFKQQAFWIDRLTVAIQPQYLQSGWMYSLTSDPTASLKLTPTGVQGGSSLSLTPFPGGLTASELARFPQLGGYAILHLPANTKVAALDSELKGQLAVSAVGSDGALKYATSVQNAGVLDDLFYYSGKLGVVIHHDGRENEWRDFEDDENADIKIKVWAPTAQSMTLQLFHAESDTAPYATIAMHEHNGVWVARGDRGWIGEYYLLDENVIVPSQHKIVENIVTDPYSIDLALNGTRSRITDLESEHSKPFKWDFETSPELRSVNDLTIYELHIRDFSIADSRVPSALRGTYLAFANPSTDGMQHLHNLAKSGLKAVHLLPSFHFASINEDRTTYKTTPDLSGFPPDSDQQQEAVAAIQNSDGYNWGYDPVHYFAPEGGYAFNPGNRVLEYRTMVQGLHRAGLRVIQDVVFNHTSASGENPNSVLDEVVPGYYQRLDANGTQETGSCCNDTAAEHRMFGKLVTDAVVLNAREYKIDGFRFDLMSFLFISNLQDVQNALAKLTMEKDGVDGAKIYLYGEGFDFGEVANDALGVNASQANLYGHGVGSFNDRIRDGIRGGSPFTDVRVQGFATGLATDSSNYTNANQGQPDQLNTLLQYTDWINVGLTGNLRDYSLTDHNGNTVTGAQVPYNGQPTGYTAAPSEAINYCSVHDNQTLFDGVQLKSAGSDSAAVRSRRQALALSLIALGQGIPFFHAGDDLLRSKDMDTNSYDSGDWFNKIDWTGQGNNWGIGLPIASQNQGNWLIYQPLLANASLKPAPADIRFSENAFREFLEIRGSSNLFRMHTASEVEANLHFLNVGQTQIPGVVVLKLDANGIDYGPYQHILVVFNATNAELNFQNAALLGLKLNLHPVQRKSGDPVVRTASFNSKTGAATVPALTTAVFVQ